MKLDRGEFMALRLVIESSIAFVRTDCGGRSSPVWSGYRPQFYFLGKDYDCEVCFASSDATQPGDRVLAQVMLSAYATEALADKLNLNQSFELREGLRVVARGEIKGFCPSPLNQQLDKETSQ